MIQAVALPRGGGEPGLDRWVFMETDHSALVNGQCQTGRLDPAFSTPASHGPSQSLPSWIAGCGSADRSRSAHSLSNQDGCALSCITKDQSHLSHRAQNLAGCRSRASSLCAGAEDGVAPAFVVEKAERVETVGNSTKASTKPMGIRARGRWPGSLGDARVGFLSVGSGVGDGVELPPGKKQGRR